MKSVLVTTLFAFLLSPGANSKGKNPIAGHWHKECEKGKSTFSALMTETSFFNLDNTFTSVVLMYKGLECNEPIYVEQQSGTYSYGNKNQVNFVVLNKTVTPLSDLGVGFLSRFKVCNTTRWKKGQTQTIGCVKPRGNKVTSFFSFNKNFMEVKFLKPGATELKKDNFMTSKYKRIKKL